MNKDSKNTQQEYDWYTNCIQLSSQFRFCGNPFRVDTYKDCDFGCTYCFARARGGNYNLRKQISKISKIETYLKDTFEKEKPLISVNRELIAHKVPFHLGGMADPFQEDEWEIKNTYKLIELTNKYHYPMVISTKTAHLPQEYWDILNPEIHAFQISLFSANQERVSFFEKNTPTVEERINFMKELKAKGFWVGCRIQPLIDIDGAVELVEKISDIIDYITVEHLKISNDNRELAKFLFANSPYKITDYKSTGRSYELKTDIKKQNIERIKAVAKCPVGCGDNDLHEMSDSCCCCGIDTINKNFDNWLKYNQMNINMTGSHDWWAPEGNVHSSFNGDCVRKGYCYKDYVDEYIKNGPPDKICHFKMEK